MRIFFQNICCDYEAKKQLLIWSSNPELSIKDWKYDSAPEMLDFIKWENRLEKVFWNISFQEADIVCLVECQKCQFDALKEKFGDEFDSCKAIAYPFALKDYKEKNFDGEIYNTVFFNIRKYLFQKQIVFDIGKKFTVLFVKLFEKKTGRSFWLAIHHHGYYQRKDEQDEIYDILQFVNSEIKDEPIIFCGHENIHPVKSSGQKNANIWKFIDDGFQDTYQMSDKLFTYYNKPEAPNKCYGRRFCYLFYRGFNLKENIKFHNEILSKMKPKLDTNEGKELLMKTFGSDHIPLMSDFL